MRTNHRTLSALYYLKLAINQYPNFEHPLLQKHATPLWVEVPNGESDYNAITANDSVQDI